jgi:hypothetical protein
MTATPCPAIPAKGLAWHRCGTESKHGQQGVERSWVTSAGNGQGVSSAERRPREKNGPRARLKAFPAEGQGKYL